MLEYNPTTNFSKKSEILKMSNYNHSTVFKIPPAAYLNCRGQYTCKQKTLAHEKYLKNMWVCWRFSWTIPHFQLEYYHKWKMESIVRILGEEWSFIMQIYNGDFLHCFGTQPVHSLVCRTVYDFRVWYVISGRNFKTIILSQLAGFD